MTAALGIIGEFGACRRGSHGSVPAFGVFTVSLALRRVLQRAFRATRKPRRGQASWLHRHVQAASRSLSDVPRLSRSGQTPNQSLETTAGLSLRVSVYRPSYQQIYP